jgi:hypothetical protein
VVAVEVESILVSEGKALERQYYLIGEIIEQFRFGIIKRSLSNTVLMMMYRTHRKNFIPQRRHCKKTNYEIICGASKAPEQPS